MSTVFSSLEVLYASTQRPPLSQALDSSEDDRCQIIPHVSETVYDLSLADRTITARKRGSTIGFVMDPFRYRQIWFESGLELVILMTLMINPNVIEIREQQSLPYRLGGMLKHYTCDFLVRMRDGSWIVYEVKWAADAVKRDTRLMLKNYADGGVDKIGEVRLVMENAVSYAGISNARDIIACAGDQDDYAKSAVEAYLTQAPRIVTLEQIGIETRLRYRGERAAKALIQRGKLDFDQTRLLTGETAFCNRYSQ